MFTQVETDFECQARSRNETKQNLAEKSDITKRLMLCDDYNFRYRGSLKDRSSFSAKP